MGAMRPEAQAAAVMSDVIRQGRFRVLYFRGGEGAGDGIGASFRGGESRGIGKGIEVGWVAIGRSDPRESLRSILGITAR